MLGYTRQQLLASAAIFTAEEIIQQPATWRKTLAQMNALKESLRDFLEPVTAARDASVIFTGAGTSEYVGNTLRPHLYLPLGGRAESFGSTDLVATPRRYLSPDRPTLLVSFARSGNSPESLGAVAAADAICGNVRHLFITCNHEGALARAAAGRADCFSIELTPETHDRSFAMTSSFSNMYLAALLAFQDQSKEDLEAVCASAERFLTEKAPVLRQLIEDFAFTRIVYLGSDVLRGIAQESALKILELTAGRVAALHDTPMGFRHGPKSFVDPETLIVLYLSDQPETRRYEMDLLRELSRQRKGNRILTVTNSPDDEAVALSDLLLPLETGRALPNGLLAPLYIPVAQCMGLFRSLSLGITPDNPCPTGEVNRVVQGVTIYPV